VPQDLRSFRLRVTHHHGQHRRAQDGECEPVYALPLPGIPHTILFLSYFSKEETVFYTFDFLSVTTSKFTCTGILSSGT
jgi:hypothetical protein